MMFLAMVIGFAVLRVAGLPLTRYPVYSLVRAIIDFDAPVLGAAFRRRVVGDRRVSTLAIDVDAVGLGQYRA